MASRRRCRSPPAVAPSRASRRTAKGLSCSCRQPRDGDPARRAILRGRAARHAARRRVRRSPDQPRAAAATRYRCGGCSRARRLERGRAILTDHGCTRLRVIDIATACNFHEVSTFIRLCRRQYGVSPTVLRQAAGLHVRDARVITHGHGLHHAAMALQAWAP